MSGWDQFGDLFDLEREFKVRDATALAHHLCHIACQLRSSDPIGITEAELELLDSVLPPQPGPDNDLPLYYFGSRVVVIPNDWTHA